MSDVVNLSIPGGTLADIPPDRMLENTKGELNTLVVIGEAKDGSFWFASSVADLDKTLWLVERARHRVHTMADEHE